MLFSGDLLFTVCSEKNQHKMISFDLVDGGSHDPGLAARLMRRLTRGKGLLHTLLGLSPCRGGSDRLQISDNMGFSWIKAPQSRGRSLTGFSHFPNSSAIGGEKRLQIWA